MSVTLSEVGRLGLADSIPVLLTLPDPAPDGVDQAVRESVAARLIAQRTQFIENETVAEDVLTAVKPLTDMSFRNTVTGAINTAEAHPRLLDALGQGAGSGGTELSEWALMAMYIAAVNARRHHPVYADQYHE